MQIRSASLYDAPRRRPLPRYAFSRASGVAPFLFDVPPAGLVQRRRGGNPARHTGTVSSTLQRRLRMWAGSRPLPEFAAGWPCFREPSSPSSLPSLVQLPLIYALRGPGCRIGVRTAHSDSLTRHFRQECVSCARLTALSIVGMEGGPALRETIPGGFHPVYNINLCSPTRPFAYSGNSGCGGKSLAPNLRGGVYGRH